MGETGEFITGSAINTSKAFGEETRVDTHMAELRADIQTHLQESFPTLPEVKTTLLPITKYLSDNPQSVIFVPQKDMNMFPVLIEEAKTFAAKYDTRQKLDQIRDHEFEHIQKAYELGIDVKGVGLVVF